MEKLTYTYSHDHSNDTLIELVKCPGRTEIEIDFDMEDPNVGKEIAVYGTDEDVDFAVLAQEWLDEIIAYLDGDESEAKIYDDYTSNMHYCIANSLEWLINGPLNIHNGRYMTIDNAAKLVASRLWRDGTQTFAFCESDCEEAKQDPSKHKDEGGWYGIKRLEGFFDNEPDEFIIAVGQFGGGSFGFGYTDQESTTYERIMAVRRALILATKLDVDNYIYIEGDNEGKRREE